MYQSILRHDVHLSSPAAGCRPRPVRPTTCRRRSMRRVPRAVSGQSPARRDDSRCPGAENNLSTSAATDRMARTRRRRAAAGETRRRCRGRARMWRLAHPAARPQPGGPPLRRKAVREKWPRRQLLSASPARSQAAPSRLVPSFPPRRTRKSRPRHSPQPAPPRSAGTSGTRRARQYTAATCASGEVCATLATEKFARRTNAPS
jgi:hypothetical protein